MNLPLERALQLRDRSGKTANPKARSALFVILCDDARAFVHIGEQAVLGVRHDENHFHHRCFEECDDRLPQLRGAIEGA